MPENQTFLSHHEIKEHAQNILNGNMDVEGQHNREGLDDLIADLRQLRDSIPSVAQYDL